MNQNSNSLKNDRDNDEFYSELDKKSIHQSYCTCQTLVIFFAFITIIVGALIYYIYWYVNHGLNFSLANKHSVAVEDLTSKLDNPTVNGNEVTLILSDNELNTVLNGGLSVDNFVLKDIVLIINPKEILIYGSLIKPFNSKVVITSSLQIKEDKVKIVINKFSAGKLTFPNFVDKQIANVINDGLDKKMVNFYKNYKVTDTILDQNKLIIKGQKK